MSDQQSELFKRTSGKKTGPVECLGMTFESDAARRAYFREVLREKLADPEYRRTPGFPLGPDEAILQLSDPPYFTACPNPFLPEIDHITTRQPRSVPPFVTDVKEGKNDPVYNAHSYHTKVPHKAIMRFILHYTEPEAVVLDPFAGTGMTGVAASACGAPSDAFRREVESEFHASGLPSPTWGARTAVLADLSPVATFIAHKFTSPTDADQFESKASRILESVEDSLGWMFTTTHVDGRVGKIHYTLWSDVFGCPECASEMVFWAVAIDRDAGGVLDKFTCPSCRSVVSKSSADRIYESTFDRDLGTAVRQAKQVPVLINYSVPGISGRLEKIPDADDLERISRAEALVSSDWYPSSRLPDGGETRRNDSIGLTHIHHFYTRRNLLALAALRRRIWESLDDAPTLGMWFTSTHAWGTRLNRLLTSNYFQKRGGVIGQTLQGTLYVSSLSIETNILERFRLRIRSVPHTAPARNAYTSTASATSISMPDDSVDYIFTDPPFGANIQYSELNILWESWLGLHTAYSAEAVENRARHRTLDDYQQIMEQSFHECFRVLKAGGWMTVEFSNTKARVWNAIQVAIQRAGFIVASVAALEKSHKGYRAVTTATAVKQDLVISCYKPSASLQASVQNAATKPDAVWEFMSSHLARLPVHQRIAGDLVVVQERTAPFLYDRWVAAAVSAGQPVTLSSGEFMGGLEQRFPVRDGMYFLASEVAAYDRVQMTSHQAGQSSLFIVDETSAIRWLRNRLQKRPEPYQDVSPHFMRELRNWQKHERSLELAELLKQNFLCYVGDGPVPAQIVAYLRQSSTCRPLVDAGRLDDNGGLHTSDSKLLRAASDRWYVPNPANQVDLDKVREKVLLREFETYKKSAKKRLKEVRAEAVRAGFSAALKRGDNDTIIAIAERLPSALLYEDEHLLMYYDVARTRAGA